MKSLIAKYIVKPFKSISYFGRFRFWCLYWAYRITGWHIRDKEWDYVLEYLPKLHNKDQEIKLLDVGCSRNLFCFEVISRGYRLCGLDLEIPNFKYPAVFVQGDVRNILSVGKYNFITCISVLEHIENDKDVALKNMINFLEIGGRLLITIPTMEFAQGHPWKGFTIKSFEALLPKNCVINNCVERAGQYCMCIERTE